MLENILGRIPANLIITCALLTMLIPFGIYKFNGFMHKKGDPPWKEDLNSKKKNEKIPGGKKGKNRKGG